MKLSKRKGPTTSSLMPVCAVAISEVQWGRPRRRVRCSGRPSSNWRWRGRPGRDGRCRGRRRRGRGRDRCSGIHRQRSRDMWCFSAGSWYGIPFVEQVITRVDVKVCKRGPFVGRAGQVIYL